MAPPAADNEDEQPCYSVTEEVPAATCLHCSGTFQSNNKLHEHLKDCVSKHTAAALDDTTVAYYATQPEGSEADALHPELPVIRSDARCLVANVGHRPGCHTFCPCGMKWVSSIAAVLERRQAKRRK